MRPIKNDNSSRNWKSKEKKRKEKYNNLIADNKFYDDEDLFGEIPSKKEKEK